MNRNTTFMAWNLMHVARLLKDTHALRVVWLSRLVTVVTSWVSLRKR